MKKDEYQDRQKQIKTNIEKVQKVKAMIASQKPDLVINRGLGSSIENFKEWSKEEFKNDYGQSFRFLWELCFPRALEIEQRIEELETKIDALGTGESKENKIKTVSGKVIR